MLVSVVLVLGRPHVCETVAAERRVGESVGSVPHQVEVGVVAGPDHEHLAVGLDRERVRWPVLGVGELGDAPGERRVERAARQDPRHR